LGALVAGAAAHRFGAPTTVLVGGGLCLALTALFVRGLPALRAHIRPVYVRLGILTEEGPVGVPELRE